MAGLQQRNGSYRILFRFHSKQHVFTLGKVSSQEAETKSAQVDYLLLRLKQGLIELPSGCDIVTFLQHDGKPPQSRTGSSDSSNEQITLSSLRDRYLETRSNGTLEANTLATIRLHFGHLVRLIGESFPMAELTLSVLQEYVNKRAKSVSSVTVRKELSTLRAAWNWGELFNLTSGRFPNKGLSYPKTDEKLPFMTFDEIQRRIAAGGDHKKLWEYLYLRSEEVIELLNHVKQVETLPWVYPMFVFAAHTGARRSEIIRVTVEDVDFTDNVVTLREKKRRVGERTTRRVPLTPLLKEALQTWLIQHPGGSFLFCQAGIVPRSKKRSQTTGHQSGKERSKSLKGRLATVSLRETSSPTGLSLKEIYYFFKDALKGSRWEVIRGLHTFRHSFVSICAAKGVDQRMLEAWAGHMSTDMSRRYTHIRPDSQQESIKNAFA